MTNQQPRFSVIVPTHNRANTLSRAIKSVLRQTCGDFELIIVDDASTDTTQELVRSFADPRVRYERHATNRYAAAARNTAMRMARGKYLAFLDSDDEWLENKLEVQLEMMEPLPSDWGCCYSGAYVVDQNSGRSTVYAPSCDGSVLTRYLTNQFVVWTPTFVFRRSCLDDVGLMDESLIRCQDRDFYVRLFQKYKTAVVPDPLARIYLQSEATNVKASRLARQAFLQKHRDMLANLGWLRSRYVHAFQWCLQAELEFSHGQVTRGLRSAATSFGYLPLLPPKRYAALAYKLGKAVTSSTRQPKSSNETHTMLNPPEQSI